MEIHDNIYIYIYKNIYYNIKQFELLMFEAYKHTYMGAIVRMSDYVDYSCYKLYYVKFINYCLNF